MTFFVLPGSPDSDTYNNQLPDERTSMVYGVGRVTGSPQTVDDGHGSRAVTVTVSDFVCGETKASGAPNTAIQFYRLCRGLIPTGILRLKVASTSLNISSNASAPSDDTSGSAGSTASAPVTPLKRRKFDPPSRPSSVDSPDSPLASSTSTPSSNVPTSMASVPGPNVRIGPMHYSQLFQQYPQYMLPPTGAYVPPFHPPQGLYTMPGYPTFQPVYTPYNSRAEYTLPASIDFRAPASTLHPDSADISSASVALPSTVPVPDNSTFNRSVANPYSYPMTQVPRVANSSTASTLQSNTSTSV
ncbi:hypothetical protein B0H13DRAFT_2281408 [Mycena leptocephala]|nr:hypothetical protein B0H13DRAFT_2281408 [Mycena leptocephala]